MKKVRGYKSNTNEIKWCNKCQSLLPRIAFGVRTNGISVCYCIPCMVAYNHRKHSERWKRQLEQRLMQHWAKLGILRIENTAKGR